MFNECYLASFLQNYSSRNLSTRVEVGLEYLEHWPRLFQGSSFVFQTCQHHLSTACLVNKSLPQHHNLALQKYNQWRFELIFILVPFTLRFHFPMPSGVIVKGLLFSGLEKTKVRFSLPVPGTFSSSSAWIMKKSWFTFSVRFFISPLVKFVKDGNLSFTFSISISSLWN